MSRRCEASIRVLDKKLIIIRVPSLIRNSNEYAPQNVVLKIN